MAHHVDAPVHPYTVLLHVALRALTVAIVFALAIGTTSAQEGSGTASTPASSSSESDEAPAAPTVDELAAFFDGVIPDLLETHDVPGLAITVVLPNGEVFAEGYGFAEFEPDRPMTSATPLGTGSVAKVFTWTALMQLVERGEVDLDAPVDDYLDFEIPATFDEPIRVRDLLAHTPGFEDYPLAGLFTRDADTIPELAEALSRRLPAREWAPGVEIFAPLGMSTATFLQPVPDDVAAQAAHGYAPDGASGFAATGPEYVTLYPAGGMVMSVEDAARFLQAHLGDGSVDGARILDPATVERMRTTLFRHDPLLPGNAYGWWQSERHGERILQHAGDTLAFHSQMALLPDRGLGMYFATNGVTGALLRDPLWEAFLDRFYPAAAPTPVDAATGDAGRYTGIYGTNRIASTSVGKVGLLVQTLSARVEDDRFVAGFMGAQNEWIPVGDGRFADAEREGEFVQFVLDEDGRRVAYASEAPMMVFRQLRWFEHPTLHLGLLGIAAVAFLSALVVVPVAAWRARRRQRADRRTAAPIERTRWLYLAAAVALLGFVAGFAVTMANPVGPAFGLSVPFTAGLVAGIVGAVLTAGIALATIFAWLLEWWQRWERIYLTVVTVVALAFVWQLQFWNLLGFQV